MTNPTPRGPNENPNALDSPEITALTFPGGVQVELTIRTQAGRTYRCGIHRFARHAGVECAGGDRVAAGATLVVQDTGGIGAQTILSGR
jgi:hypothetical protein